MNIIDLHCDTIDKLMDYPNSNLLKNNFSVDIEKLQKSNSLAQVFALFFELNKYKDNPFRRFEDMANKFFTEIEKNKDFIGLAKSYNDIIQNQKEKKISAILSVEEGGAISSNLDNLIKMYDMGIRLITLTWNFENEIGYPHSKKGYENVGLKPFGIDVVEKMNSLGMIIDVSHLNDGGFYNVAQISKKPFIASHSNARSITNHSRNLTDDMINILANHGGVTGINFYNLFLGNDYYSNIDDIVHHIKHISNIGGIDVVALGSDFDGIPNGLEIEDISQIYKLECALLKSGFNYNEVEKIMYKNALRVIKDVL